MACCAGKILLTLIILGLTAVAIYNKFKKRKRTDLIRKHIIITGGSSGIGKALAILAAKEGAHVTIVARNKDRLKEAENQVKDACINVNQKITSISVDVSDFKALKEEFEKVENDIGPIFGLVNCAGFAICGKIEDFSIPDIQSMINVNYLGSLYPTQLVVPKMKEHKQGFIAFTASQVALMGMFGYSIYSSCKFALRGLAESLDMELGPYNISVTLALPPDTDTPGFENENKTKPLETKLLSEVGGLFKPEQVAERMFKDILVCSFF